MGENWNKQGVSFFLTAQGDLFAMSLYGNGTFVLLSAKARN